MIDYNQIMQDLPVQNFIKSNFKRDPDYMGYSYKIQNVRCIVSESFISFPTIEGKFYLTIGNYPEAAFHAEKLEDDWGFELNDIHSNADLFNIHVEKNMFGMDYNFCEYLKALRVQVIKEFFPWKM